MFQRLLLISVVVGVAVCSPLKQLKAASGCQSCHAVDPDKINVHLIPHSHDDVGWLKTVDQYYYGSENHIQRAGVQYIISSTVEALKANPDRRFVQVETAFFWKWWQHQNEATRQDFVGLVNNGQIEIINAAWSMNDEAATNYQSVIDHFTWGLRTINDTIGECGIPRIGWQIDPFGHSREQASIFAQLGYDGVFFARIDYNDKNERIRTKNMETIWQGSSSLENNNIFTNVFPDFYYSPSGFCFDIECGDEVINDNLNSPSYNVPTKVSDFERQVNNWATFYKTKNVLVPMGGDFHYQSAEKNFVNTDKLIRGFKNNSNLNVIYSTPSCYIEAVNKAATDNNVEFTLKTDDYFPYGSDPHCYWTGYFTSRPNAKRFERLSNNILQSAKLLTSISKALGQDVTPTITPLKEALGIMQHHDAITGTARQAVAKDYVRLLTRGIAKVDRTLGTIEQTTLEIPGSNAFNLDLKTCLLTNVSICADTKKDRFVVTVQNPLARNVTHYVRLPVPDGTYKVTGPAGEEVADLLDAISSFDYIKDLSETPLPKELVFAARNISAFGLQLYYVERTDSKSMQAGPAPWDLLGTENTGFEIDASGHLFSVTSNGQKLAVRQQFVYYEGYNGYQTDDDDRASGAYIFRPKHNVATELDVTSFVVTTGKLVDEVRQVINNWATQIIRVYKGPADNHIEFDWVVGPIEVDEINGIGKEIVSRFTVANFDSSNTFYTDSNGRELIKRILNKRYDYEYDSTLEPIASNYYPVTSKISIKDEAKKLQVSVLNDRAQGGSSLSNGALELMVHRRLLRDDAKGVSEPLDDQEFGQGEVARGQHYLVIGSSDNTNPSTNSVERNLALRKLLQPLVLVGSPDGLSLEKIKASFNFEFIHAKNVPDNVHVLTLEPWKENTYLFRLEHIYEKGEDSVLSQTATVNLAEVFLMFDITSIRETTLGGNQWLDKFEAKNKYVWNLQGGKHTSNNKQSRRELAEGELEISLEPMQIRTFIIEVALKA